MLPASSSSITDTAAILTEGDTRKITADRVTMVRIKKKMAIDSMAGRIIGSVMRLIVVDKLAPRQAEVSSKLLDICFKLVVAVKNPWAW